MEHISKVVDVQRQQSSQMESATHSIDPGREKLIAQVFARLQFHYGGLWAARFPTDDMVRAGRGEWLQQLEGFSEQEIRAALDMVSDRYPESPPIPGQFKKLCRPEKHPMYNTSRDHLLPAPDINPEIPKANLAAIREILDRSRS